MKIALVTGEFPVVSQTFIANKALRLARAGLNVTVMATGRGDAAFYRSLLSDLPKGLTVQYLPPRDQPLRAATRLPMMLTAAWRRSPGDVRRLLAILRSRHTSRARYLTHLYRLLPFGGLRPDVMHFEFAGRAVDLIELFDLLPCAKVVSCRGADIRILPLRHPHLAGSLREVFSKADRVHCVSEEILERARQYGLDPARAFINYPSIDAQFFTPPAELRRDEAPPTILSVGRLHWKKGYEYAVQAMHLLKERGHQFRYRILGTGPAEDAVRYAIWEYGLGEHVELLGAQPREGVREHLSRSDVFLLPSLDEGISNAVLEAMAMKLPVVTTAAGGMPEAVRDGIDGFVVPTRSPETMADRLGKLLADPDLRRRAGEAGRQRVVESFTLERQTERFVQCYLDLATRREGPALSPQGAVGSTLQV